MVQKEKREDVFGELVLQSAPNLPQRIFGCLRF